MDYECASCFCFCTDPQANICPYCGQDALIPTWFDVAFDLAFDLEEEETNDRR
jgi:RNA polymerase subunit RPABC4/transcription elongation factor Spt4